MLLYMFIVVNVSMALDFLILGDLGSVSTQGAGPRSNFLIHSLMGQDWAPARHAKG